MFLAIFYKGVCVHETDGASCRVLFANGFGRNVKSYRAAQLYITRYLKAYPSTVRFPEGV